MAILQLNIFCKRNDRKSFMARFSWDSTKTLLFVRIEVTKEVKRHLGFSTLWTPLGSERINIPLFTWHLLMLLWNLKNKSFSPLLSLQDPLSEPSYLRVKQMFLSLRETARWRMLEYRYSHKWMIFNNMYLIVLCQLLTS